MLTTVAIVGHSHTPSILKALPAPHEPWAAPGIVRVHAVNLRELMPSLGLKTQDVTRLEPPGSPRLHPAVIAEIDAAVAPDSRMYFVSMVGGNAHNVLGLFRHAWPFDFVLPEAPDLPVEAGAQVIPYTAMKACLERRLHYDRSTLDALRRQYPGPFLHLESPPPPRDDAFVAAALEEFRTLSPDGTVVSAALRYKLWRLHSAIVESFCAALGITFVRVPSEACDEDGFLVPQACEDATHANAWYGRRLLDQIEGIVMEDRDDRRVA